MSDSTCKRENSPSTKRLIGVGGRIKSGKNSAANFIAGINLVTHGIIEEFKSNDDGSISVDGQRVHVNDIAPSFVKLYGYADGLKHIVCDLFNLNVADAFGSDVDKNKPTHICWENMPGIMTRKDLFQATKKFVEKRESLLGMRDHGFSVYYHEPGPMSIRDILQYFGTEVCRKIYGNCWINYLMNQIQRDSPKIAIIYDCRFDNEVDAIKQKGGLCLYLKRHIPVSVSEHASENGFVHFNQWDAMIDNQDCEDVRCLNRVLYESLKDLEVFTKIND